MNTKNNLSVLFKINDEVISHKTIQRLLRLNDHPNKKIRIDLSKKFIYLILQRDHTLSLAILDHFKNVHCEKCCCIKYLKAIGLSELAKSTHETISLFAIKQLMKLKNDDSNKVRFIVVNTIKNLPASFLKKHTKLSSEIKNGLSSWLSDQNTWVRDEAKLILN